MLEKIISGGQTGADRAALDVAIKMDISHGGWVPKGRKAEDGPLPEKYRLQEMSTESYSKRTEKKVLDSDGTLILSHGKLTGGSALTKKFALKNGKPYLHIDLNTIGAFVAEGSINKWILQNNIAILNVAGPRASKDPKIYRLTSDILETVLCLHAIDVDMLSNSKTPIVINGMMNLIDLPKTVDEAVGFFLSKLSLKNKTAIANMSLDQLSHLHIPLGEFICDNFYLSEGNADLLQSCRSVAGRNYLSADGASMVIIKEVWTALRKTHKLRAVK